MIPLNKSKSKNKYNKFKSTTFGGERAGIETTVDKIIKF